MCSRGLASRKYPATFGNLIQFNWFLALISVIAVSNKTDEQKALLQL